MTAASRKTIRARFALVSARAPAVQLWTKSRTPPTYARECARRCRQIARGILPMPFSAWQTGERVKNYE